MWFFGNSVECLEKYDNFTGMSAAAEGSMVDTVGSSTVINTTSGRFLWGGLAGSQPSFPHPWEGPVTLR